MGPVSSPPYFAKLDRTHLLSQTTTGAQKIGGIWTWPVRVVSKTSLQAQPLTAWLFIADRGAALVQETFATSSGRGNARTTSQGLARYSRYGEPLTVPLPACATTARIASQVLNVSLLKIGT